MPAPRAPHFLTVTEGKIVDESRDPELYRVFAVDMRRSAPMCLSNKRHRNVATAGLSLTMMSISGNLL
jgi:hypothetical protein